MKKELTAAAIIIVLLGGALVNIMYLRGFIGSLTSSVELSRGQLESGDAPAAERTLRSAIDRWTGSDGYTHIFIRHSEIDAATDAFYELLSYVLSEDAPSAAGAYEKLGARLTSIMTMEYVTLGSIF